MPRTCFAPLVISLLLLACRPEAHAQVRAGCAARETAVVIETGAHSLALCERGTVVRRFTVALGAGGVGKRRMGDGKTPLGLYPLAAPRRSRHYGTFIGVGYPTRQQVRMGFTGHSVGLHGPPRGVSGVLRNDWTAGCIALGTDAEVAELAAWMARHRVRWVRIH